MKPVLLTMGDPAGIGPEVCLKALDADPTIRKEAVIAGSFEILQAMHASLRLRAPLHAMANEGDWEEDAIHVLNVYPCSAEGLRMGTVSAHAGDAAFHCVASAIRLVQEGCGSAVVTAPLNKEALHLAGHNYDGHTEIFADMTHTSDYAMMLWSEKLCVVHNSTHCSLAEACRRVKAPRIHTCIVLAGQAMQRLGLPRPRIAVAGLNPHSSENGLFGSEEAREIQPAIERAQAEGWDVTGPVSPDTVFLRALQGQFDVVVAMYHDQGHIPMKLVAFDSGVNVTLGIPIVRTSVDHGTGFDIAGKGIASATSMLAAIHLAGQFVKNRSISATGQRKENHEDFENR